MGALQFGYDAGKDRVKTRLLNLVGGVIVDIMQRGKGGSELMKTIDALTHSDKIMDASTQRKTRSHLPITPVAVLVNHHTN